MALLDEAVAINRAYGRETTMNATALAIAQRLSWEVCRFRIHIIRQEKARPPFMATAPHYVCQCTC